MQYRYQDYFREEQAGIPYADSGEALEERLTFCEALLESYLEHFLLDEELSFHRGIVMTEAAASLYYDTPPKARMRGRLDRLCLAELEKMREHIRGREAVSAEARVFLPFLVLRRQMGLSGFEEFVLMLVAAHEARQSFARLLPLVNQNELPGVFTLGGAMALWEAMGERLEDSGIGGYLTGYQDSMLPLLLHSDGAKSASSGVQLYRKELVLEPVIRDFLLGDGPGKIPAHSAHSVSAASGSGGSEDARAGAPVFFEEAVEGLLRLFEHAPLEPVQIYLDVREEAEAEHLLEAFAARIGRNLLFAAEPLLEGQSAAQREAGEQALRDALLAARIRDGILAVRLYSGSGIADGKWRRPEEAEGVRLRLQALLDEVRRYLPEGMVYFYGSGGSGRQLHGLPVADSFFRFQVAPPNARTREAMWNYFAAQCGLADARDVDFSDLADCYTLSIGGIRSVCREAAKKCQALGAAQLTKEILLPLLYAQGEAQFANLATYVPAAYSWADIEIAEKERKVIQSACRRYRYRNRLDERYHVAAKNAYGNGVSILLYGPPGTGKTMAARVISNELSLPLYKVDVSQIFSKYIGETQKNLATIFDEAQKSNCILFFDEADALFTKRTEVTDSKDKYANAETSFLLQKIEEFSGLTILATNLYHQFDPAFVRRITFVARFDAPDAAVRGRLWRNVLPESVPISSDVDFDFLAQQFELSGGNIKSIMLSAAYMGLSKGDAVTPADITRAIRYEFVKLGRIIDPGAFGKYVVYLYE